MKIYAIGGLGADRRVFAYLRLRFELVPIDWIAVQEKETLESYSRRMGQVIDTSEDFAILGVSFGGLVAVELSKYLEPKQTILISSAENKYELSWLYRLVGKTAILNIVPASLFYIPPVFANLLFGAVNKKLLKEILIDTDLSFVKWALIQLTTWQNTDTLTNVLKIAGTHDRLIAASKDPKNVLIQDGAHFMIVDRAEEISAVINAYLKP